MTLFLFGKRYAAFSKALSFFILLTGLSIESTSQTAQTEQANVPLTKKEIKLGWKTLFDGQSLKGWRVYQNKSSDAWSVKDGTIYCKGKSSDSKMKSADLITVDQYDNFILTFDWKIAPKGNSGVLYLVTEEYPESYHSGPEYQLIDDENYPDKLEDWQKTGANYAMNVPTSHPANPVGSWNHSMILVNKKHVEHWLNNKKVVGYMIKSDAWEKNKAEGKWKDYPGYGMAKKGFIALQNHGDEAWFKNIKIRPLD